MEVNNLDLLKENEKKKSILLSFPEKNGKIVLIGGKKKLLQTAII